MAVSIHLATPGVPLQIAANSTYFVPNNTQVLYASTIYLQSNAMIYTAGNALLVGVKVS